MNSVFKIPFIFQAPPVEDEPSVELTLYRIVEITAPSRGWIKTRHFLGRREDGNGRVSTPIVAFDKKTRIGKTLSGRQYALLGEPGHDKDASFVFQIFLERIGATFWTDVTEEFLSIADESCISDEITT